MKKSVLFFALITSSFTAWANQVDTGLLFNVNGAPAAINIKTVAPNHTYPSAGIKLTTPGSRIVSGCTFNDKGYCLFSVSDTHMVTINTTGANKAIDFDLCLNGNGPLSCQQYSLKQDLAYIGNGYGSGSPTYVGVCALDPITGAIVSCEDSGQDSALSSSGGIGGIVLNNIGTMAYLTPSENYSGVMYQCSIDEQGLFDSCSSVTTTPYFYSYYGQLAINEVNNLIYLVDESNNPGNILVCGLDGAGNVNPSCANTGATSITNSTVQINLNRAATLAYIGTYDTAPLIICDITNNGLTFSSCVPRTGDGASVTFVEPAGVSLNTAESLVYIADYDTGDVYGCTPAGSGSTFNSCFVAYSGLSSPWSITINSNDTVAYIANYSETYVCPIKSDGTFDTCSFSTDTPHGTSVALSQ